MRIRVYGEHAGARALSGAAFAAWLLCASPAVAQSAGVPPVAGAERAPDSFAVYAIDVTGVTRLSAAEIETIVYPFTGEAKGNADVEAARVAIQNAYAAKGYEAVIVSLPPQDSERFRQGIITIAVAEAPVGQVRIADAKHHSTRDVLKRLPSIQPGQPIDLKAMQKELEAVNRYPDRQLVPTFVPSDTPGAVDVEFNVDEKRPWHGSLEFNNDNSPSTTRQRVSGSLRYTNLWHAGHTLAGSFIVSPQDPDNTRVFSGSYTAPLIGTSWTLLLSGYKSNSDIASAGGSNVLGNGYQIGLRAIYRLPSTSTTQTISFGADFKNFKQDIFIGATAAASTPIRYVPLALDYNLFSRDDSSGFAKHFGTSDFNLSLGGTFGLRAIKRFICAREVQDPCVPDDQFQNREVDSFENFLHINGTLAWTLTTKADVVLSTAVTGQYADTHLVTNEQFAAGGVTSVRGYFQSEAVGDDGVVTNFELQSPSAHRLLGKWVNELRLFGFVDGAHVHIRRTLPGAISNYSLLGVGGGLRTRLFDTIFGEVTVAYPLKDGPDTDKHDPRAVVIVRGEF